MKTQYLKARLNLSPWLKITICIMALQYLSGEVFAQYTSRQTVTCLPGESWWGALVNASHLMPFQATGITYDLWKTNLDNQAQPLLISSKGRYVWSELPFQFCFQGNEMVLNGGTDLQVYAGGNTLKEAYHSAQSQFFAPKGTMPAELLFRVPQWNTWIELGYNQNQKSILEYARTIINEGFPAGIIMLDDTWQQDYGEWRFHPGRFPDPKAMMDTLHALGFQVMVWVIPTVSPDSYEYRSLKDAGALLLEKPNAFVQNYPEWMQTKPQPALIRWWNGASAVLDLTKPAAMDWFKAQLDALQETYAVDGFKFDGGDWYFYPDYVDSEVPASTHAQRYCELGLSYPLNEYRAAWKMGGEPLAERLLDKNHSWTDLQKLIPGMLVQGMLGYSFGCPDMIGGGMLGSFGEKIDQELFVRSAQIHALMPMMQFSMAPWRVLDIPHLEAIKQAVALRDNRFAPLIMRLAKEAAVTGDPIVRHMEYVFPNQGFEKVQDQFMLGDSLLVTPMTVPGTHRQVLLPAGEWLGDDGKVYQGPATLEIEVPLERLPYFERKDTPKKKPRARRL